MRGASALQQILDEAPDPKPAVLIVWEPVLWSDVSPPTSTVLSQVSYPRAVQFWDEHRSLSKFMVRSAIEDPTLLAGGDPIEPDTVVWDFVAIYPAGSTWSAHARPAYYGSPVVDVIDEVRTRLAATEPR